MADPRVGMKFVQNFEKNVNSLCSKYKFQNDRDYTFFDSKGSVVATASDPKPQRRGGLFDGAVADPWIKTGGLTYKQQEITTKRWRNGYETVNTIVGENYTAIDYNHNGVVDKGEIFRNK